MLKHIPNILTIFRFILIPIIFYFVLKNNYILAVIFLILSGATDVLDGYIARKYNFVTTFGTLVDPLADKFTQIATLLVLVIKNLIPLWILLVLLLKEILMISGASFLFEKQTIAIPSKWYGKITTVLIYLAIFLSMIKKQIGLDFSIDLYLYYIAVIFAFYSLIMYYKIFAEYRKEIKSK